MTESHLPQSAVEEDHRLESSASKASERLAKHRWHWTLDESNPERVPIAVYSRAVGVDRRTIQRYAHGFADWQGGAAGRTLHEAIERAGLGAEQEAAVDAVAEARGLTPAYVRKSRGDDVRRVRDIARHTAEIKGTAVTDEIPEAAKSIVRDEDFAAEQRVERKERHSLRWVEVDGHLAKAKEALRRARVAALDVPFDEEERDLLRGDLRQVIAIAQLIDTQLSGTAVLDWDAELAKIMEGVN